ncbi:Anoctamin-8, partial [Armadillidium vulgare]
IAMEFMCLLGIMVNCMLIGLSVKFIECFQICQQRNYSSYIVLEHAMIALKYGISYAIPDIPHKIAQQLAIAEFRRREAFRKLSLSNSPPNQEESGQSTPK